MIPHHVFQDNFQLQRVMQALVPHLFEMHRFGVACGSENYDESVLIYKYEHSRKRLANLKRKFFDLIGYEINLGSWQQMRDLLYVKLGLDPAPIIKATGEAKSDKYALCMLHYLNRQDPRLDEIFNTLIEIKKLDKTISNQYGKLLLTEECPCAKKKESLNCELCGGTKRGKVLGYDPYFCSVRDGWVYTHSTYLQNQITLRIGSLDPSIGTTPRANHTRKLYPREIYVNRPGRTFVFTDLSKAERRFCAVYFDDEVMLDEVERGHAAVAEFGMELFGYTKEQVAKNTEGYSNVKTALYLSQLGGGGNALHKTLIGNYAFFTEDECWNIIGKIMQKYPYQQKIFGLAWNDLQKGWWQTFHKHRFIAQKPYELEGYSDWRQIQAGSNQKAKESFATFVRFYSASKIQDPATGTGTEIATLRLFDEIAKRPHLRDCQPCIVRHDELVTDCPVECADEIQKLQEYCLAECFEKPQPYLDSVERPELFFGMNCESEVSRQWGCSNLGKIKDAEIREGVVYRA